MKNSDQENMLTLAVFEQSYLAEQLQLLLEAEGIPSYVRNEYSNRMFGSLIGVGGVRVELLEHDYERALALLSEMEIDIANPGESQLGQVSNLAERLPFFRKKTLEFRLWALFFGLAIIVLLGVLVYYFFKGGVS